MSASNQSVVNTPGPWEAVRCEHGWHVQPVNGPEPRGICSIHDNSDGSKREEQSANAKLIAEAPLLLQRLIEITDDYEDRFDLQSSSTNPGIKIVIAEARNAILQATS